jgi:predicted nuclease of predicted toxin-antitoxin system
MRILVDECVDPRVKRLFADHETATVHEKRWDTLDDGSLLAVAQDEFDVLLTIDRGLEFQQNIAKFRLGLVVVHVPKNQIAHYQATRWSRAASRRLWISRRTGATAAPR